MTAQDISVAGEDRPPALKSERRRDCLFNPVIDFLCLGGGSLVFVGVFVLFRPENSALVTIIAVTYALAHIVNNPHFANSYQIFYRNFRRKAFGSDGSASLRARYVIAGILVPAALAIYFAVSTARGDALMLGFAGNIMVFLVGWHYVKQGYGILIVTSVLKKRFFADYEKKILLINAYACWSLYWLYANWVVSERNYWGLGHYTFNIPGPVMVVDLGIVCVTSILVLYMLVRKFLRADDGLPANGVMAYFAALYVWLFFFFDPLLLFIVPAFHSLQYLAVVWRFQLNVERVSAAPSRSRRPAFLGFALPSLTMVRFLAFVAAGVVLGYLGFWAVPEFLDGAISYDSAAFGPTMFIFMFWIFINVHHYFLDNVMWRRENPEIGKYLFAH